MKGKSASMQREITVIFAISTPQQHTKSTLCDFITSLGHSTSSRKDNCFAQLKAVRAGVVIKSDVNIFPFGTSQQKLKKREAKLQPIPLKNFLQSILSQTSLLLVAMKRSLSHER
jgi:hypothetical protein